MVIEYFTIKDKIPPREECGCTFLHNYNLNYVIFGKIEEICEILSKFDMRPPYVVLFDDITYEIAGKKILTELNAKGFSIRSPTYNEAEEKLREIKAAKTETLLAVGGGMVIDVARYIAYRAKTSFVAVPTAPSQDGIASPRSALYHVSPTGEMIYTGTADAKAPDMVIFDLSILSSAPQTLIRAGYGDIITKLTSLKDWQLARDDIGEPYCNTAEKLTLEAVNHVIEVAKEGNYLLEQNIRKLCKAIIFSGAAMGVVNSTRPAGGSEHMVGRHLEIYSHRKILHGIAAAIGTLLMANYHELRNPNWWKEKKYRVNAIKQYLNSWNIPTRLSEIGVPEEVLMNAIIESWKTRPERYTILHKYKPSVSEAKELLKILA